MSAVALFGSNVPPPVLDQVRPHARKVTSITGDRYAIEIAAKEAPDRLLGELIAAGATLVSLNPVRETLEDLFVRRVAEMGEGARGPAEAHARG